MSRLIVLLVVAALLYFVLPRLAGSGQAGPAVTEPGGQPGQAAATAAPAAGANTADAPYLPDRKFTPGDTLDVTTKDICVSGYSQKVRNVPEAVKTEVYREYGITSHKPGQYEVDHLISLELGGSNSVRNLWPQSYSGQWNAHIKDQLEDRLHVLVCDGSLDLKTAQQAIATDWIAAYRRYDVQSKR